MKKIMFEPELKTYNELIGVFGSQMSEEDLTKFINDEDFAFDWTYDYRWELFDMPIDDELLFDYRHVEDLQDMAASYKQELKENG